VRAILATFRRATFSKVPAPRGGSTEVSTGSGRAAS
jgi:hypothetical protein